jgi:hypothetical protein
MTFGVDDAIAAGLQVLNRFIPDPNAKIAAEAELRESLRKWDDAQSQTNTAEAANPNLFVSGWRPAIGWIGAAGLAYQYVIRPLATATGYGTYPALDGSLMELVMAMLGLAGLRTYEKKIGVARQ